MNQHDTRIRQSAPPHLHLSIPLEVAYDYNLSDGAILLFSEIYGSCDLRGHCLASTTHLMKRGNKTRSTINRHFRELCIRGYIRVTTNGYSRELQIAKRYLKLKNSALPFKQDKVQPKLGVFPTPALKCQSLSSLLQGTLNLFPADQHTHVLARAEETLYQKGPKFWIEVQNQSLKTRLIITELKQMIEEQKSANNSG